jgi:hypothetical protein
VTPRRPDRPWMRPTRDERISRTAGACLLFVCRNHIQGTVHRSNVAVRSRNDSYRRVIIRDADATSFSGNKVPRKDIVRRYSQIVAVRRFGRRTDCVNLRRVAPEVLRCLIDLVLNFMGTDGTFSRCQSGVRGLVVNVQCARSIDRRPCS